MKVLGAVLGIIGIVLLTAAVIGGSYMRVSARQECVAHGYPRVEYGDGSYYCIKRGAMGEDVIVKLESLRTLP